MTKKTQKEMFTQIMANPTLTEEERDFLQGRIDALTKKSANRAKTDTQKENDEIKEDILEFIGDNPNCSISEIRTQLGLSSPQKATALVRQLEADGKVIRTEEKKVGYYTLA